MFKKFFKPYLKHLNMKKSWDFQFSIYSCPRVCMCMCMNVTMLLSQPLLNGWGTDCMFPLWTKLYRRLILGHEINKQTKKQMSVLTIHLRLFPTHLSLHSLISYKDQSTLPYILPHSYPLHLCLHAKHYTLVQDIIGPSSSISNMWPRNKPWFYRNHL